MPPTENFVLLLLDDRLFDLEFHGVETSLPPEDVGKLVSLAAGLSLGFTMLAS